MTTPILSMILSSLALAADANSQPPNLAPNGSFEAERKNFGGWYPVGILPADETIGLHVVDSVHRTGKRSLRITPAPKGRGTGTRFFPDANGSENSRPETGDDPLRGARTFALRLERDVASVFASAWIKRADAAEVRLTAVWTTRRGRRHVVEIHRDSVTEPVENQQGWERFALHAPRPYEARQVQLCAETTGTSPIHVDDVELRLHLRPRVDVLVNQLGYETASRAKGVVLQSTRPMDDPPAARIIDVEAQTDVLTAAWVEHGYLPAWDRYHWAADFSELKKPGRYTVLVGKGPDAPRSPVFEIADDLVTARTAKLAYRYYYHQRCGTAVEGFHQPCHLDDAKMPDGSWRDLAGGWHDAGDYNKYNGYTPESLYALMAAYTRKPALFDPWDEDRNGLPDIVDEAQWGARFLRKALDDKTLTLLGTITSGYGFWGRPELETDNMPDTGDERRVQSGSGDPAHCVAGFALLGRALNQAGQTQKGGEYVGLARRLYANIGGGIDRLVPLLIATKDDAYRAAARKRAEALLAQQGAAGVAGFRELAEYALAFADDPLTAKIRPLAGRRVAELQKMCDERFGIVQLPGPDGTKLYFRPYNDINDWHIGQTMNYLDAAIDAVLADRLGAPEGRTLAENQVHWILGRNPFGVSTMEAVGRVFLPGYHHRYNTVPGNPRGAVPGALVNGITRLCPEHDRPWLDLFDAPTADWQSNEPWLPHNNRWLLLISLW